MNGLTLAYLGDASYELEIRKYLIEKGITHANKLHNEAVKYTSNEAQASIINKFIEEEILSDIEVSMFKKGRNHSSSGRRNVDGQTYVLATGFESLIGYLFLNDKERFNQLVKKAIDVVNEVKQ